MNTKPTFTNAAVWLMMLREGGRWSAAEVGARIGMDQSQVANNLRAMEQFGTLKRWDRGDKPTDRVRFGVTPECTIPRGVTVADIVASNIGLDAA